MRLSELLEGGEGFLRNQIALGLSESLHLELKGNGRGDGAIFDSQGKITSKGRPLLGKAISALANSAGGVLLVGVECKAELATSANPIPNVVLAASHLSGELGELLQPRHDGITVHVVPSAVSPGGGYLAVDVVRSDRRPHMSVDKRYYKRAGSSSFAMEHYDVEDAFKRTVGPVLRVTHSLRQQGSFGGPEGRSHAFRITLAVKNEGLVTAKHILLKVRQPGRPSFEYTFSDPASRVEGARSVFDDHVARAMPEGFVIHPGDERPVDDIHFSILRSNEGSITAGKQPIETATLIAPFQLGAEGMALQGGEIVLDNTEIRALAAKIP